MTIDELKKLLEAATPATPDDPWRAFTFYSEPPYAITTELKDSDGDVSYAVLGQFQSKANTALVAAVVNALPRLLAVVEAARAYEHANIIDDRAQGRDAINEAAQGVLIARAALWAALAALEAPDGP